MKRRARGEGTVYFNEAKQLWVGNLRVGRTPQGKVTSLSVHAKRQQDVLDKMDALKAKRSTGLLASSPSRETVAEFCRRWLEDEARVTVRATTYRMYSALLQPPLRLLGGLRLTKLLPAHLQGCLADLERGGTSARGRKLIYGVLHRAFESAVREGILARNPCDAIKPPTAPRPEMRVWTPAQVGQFLKAAQADRLHALYILALSTGMRQGELYGLSWPDLHLDDGCLQVRRQLAESDRHPVLVEPKTAKARRRIDLPPMAVTALKDHRQRMLAEGHYQAEGFVFLSRDGTPLRASNVLRRSFVPLIKTAQVPRIRFHDLRHTAATLLLLRGINPKIVQERLGHATISMTLDTYSHVLPSMQADAAAQTEAILTAAVASAPKTPPATGQVIPLPRRPR